MLKLPGLYIPQLRVRTGLTAAGAGDGASLNKDTGTDSIKGSIKGCVGSRRCAQERETFDGIYAF